MPLSIKEKAKKAGLVISWGMYDMANQFFALNIVSLYYVRWLTLEKHQPEIYYSVAFGVSTVFVAVLGLIFGVISDLTGRRRPFLVALTLLSVIFTMFLGVNNIWIGLVFFAVANFGCQAAIVFYNAIMIGVVPVNKNGLISGIGKMLGYSGAILALYIFKPIVLREGYPATFVPTGLLFLLFSLPCLFFVKDVAPKIGVSTFDYIRKDKIKEVLGAVKGIFFNIGDFPGLANFLKASFFGLCAVNAVILFMSIYATRVFGMGELQVINLVTFSTFFAMAGSLLSGLVSDYLGYKRCFVGAFVLWIICFLSGALVRSPALYLAIGALTGMVLGATWVVSRALAIKLVPQEKMGQVFALFNLAGYSSAIVGPMVWALLLRLFSGMGEMGYRLTLLAQAVFVAIGLIFIMRLPDDKKHKK